MELRIALALCAVLGGGLCGRALSDAARRRAAVLSGLAEGIDVLRLHMTGMLEPVGEALGHTDCPLLQRAGEAMAGGLDAGTAWQSVRDEVIRRGGVADALDPRDLAALDRLFARLGRGRNGEQQALLEGTLSDVERLRDGARNRAREAEKLYTSLGALIGLMLAIIVI